MIKTNDTECFEGSVEPNDVDATFEQLCNKNNKNMPIC